MTVSDEPLYRIVYADGLRSHEWPWATLLRWVQHSCRHGGRNSRPVGVERVWQMVTCKSCGKNYQCTPASDYYGATTLQDGVCETCLLLEAGIHPDKVIAAPCPGCGAPFDGPPAGECVGHGTAQARMV